MGEQSLYEDFGKIFKPITEQQKKSSDEIVSKFTPLQEAIENMPPALPWGQVEGQPGVLPDAAAVAPAEHPLPINIGRIADQYMSASHGKPGDHTFGLKDKDRQFFIGNSEAGIDGNDLIIGDKRYHRTPGLWDLIVMKKTVNGFATEEDKDKYLDIIDKTNALYTVDNRGKKMLRAPNSNELKFIQRPQNKKGRGVFIPSDPNALCEWLELLMASKQAGNTGLRNAIVSICDELLRQKILSHDAYKNLMLTLNKDVNN